MCVLFVDHHQIIIMISGQQHSSNNSSSSDANVKQAKSPSSASAALVLNPSLTIPVLTIDHRTLESYWYWNNLYMKFISSAVGNGIFAATDIAACTCFPVWGIDILKRQDIPIGDASSHWLEIKSNELIGVDGSPLIAPYHGIGGQGGFIMLLLNEPRHDKIANCIFIGWRPPNNSSRPHRGFVITTCNIKQHTELTVRYSKQPQHDRYNNNNQPYQPGAHVPSPLARVIKRAACKHLHELMQQTNAIWPFNVNRTKEWYDHNRDVHSSLRTHTRR
jgi:hypothetical protein